jgi:Tfp pilus assembly protein PilN
VTDFSTRPRPKRRWPSIVMVAAGGGALLVSVAGAVRARQDAVEVRTALAEARRALDDDKQRARSLEGSRGTTDEEQLAALVVLGQQAPPAAALAALERALPADVRLESLSMSYEGELEMKMEVQARQAPAYDEFLARLTASPHFLDVVPGAESRDGALRASVRARFRRGMP